MRQRHFIDSSKASNALVIVALMAWKHSWDNVTAWLYLAEHGLYGLLWLTKSRTFADKQWEAPCGWGRGAVIWLALALYWVTPYLIVTARTSPPPWYLGLSVATFGLGVFWHFAADMQKFVWLQARPGELLTTALWSRCRNPNYFGELLIYAGFCLLGRHWAPFVVLGLFVAAVWLPNMRRKEQSLARYPDFAAWKARSALFIPYVL